MNKKALAICVFLFLVGIFAIVQSEAFVKAIVIILGVEALANGFYGFMYVRNLVPNKDFQNSIISRSLISVVVGLLAIFLPINVGAAMWDTMRVIVALHLIVTSAILLFATGTLRDADVERRQFIAESLISICVAVLMLMLTLHAIAKIVGLVLILIAGVYFLVEWLNRPIIDGKVEVKDDYDTPDESSVPLPNDSTPKDDE